MAYVPLQNLIDKVDNFEVVRDQIGVILVNEIANQKALAIAAGKPDLIPWEVRVFLERSNPWEQYLTLDPLTATDAELGPIINVWFENANPDGKNSDIVERQATTGIFNIDVYGYGLAAPDGGGHVPGDQDAAFKCQAAIRLARNILMASTNMNLQLNRRIVGKRWHRSTTMFQPNSEDPAVQKIVAGRLVLEVWFDEFSPQYEGEALELVHADINRALDGSLIAEVEVEYPL